jgi:hypothetical protein
MGRSLMLALALGLAEPVGFDLILSRRLKCLVKQGNLLSRQLGRWLVFDLVPFTRQKIHNCG